MIKKKVCMLGAFAVGKTSLVQQYVNNIFNEKYQTTLGVKIDKKTISIDHHSFDMILWDLAGEDEFMEVRTSYLRGSAGFILVADGTRGETLDVCIKLKQKVYDEVGVIPFVLLINKSDLKEQWMIDDSSLNDLEEDGWNIIETSATDYANVEDAYMVLATQLL